MGNKYKLLKQLIPLFPAECNIFFNMFGGSGVVSMNYHGEKGTFYNEFNYNIYMLAQLFKNTNPDELDVYFDNKISTYGLERCSIKAKDRVNRSGYERRKDSFNKFREDYNKPFALLLPITALEGVERGKMFREHGIELLVLDKRCDFLDNKKSNWFNTSWFCHRVLPKQLIFEELKKTN